MLIKVEPAGFFMYSVQLIFDLENPDSEDQPVREYLACHQLEPRYQSQGEYEGRQCESMQFGGCYLGQHLHAVGQLQLKAVRREALSEAIAAHLTHRQGGPPGETSGVSPDRQAVLDTLVESFDDESVFQTNEHGELIAVLDGDAVREAAQELLTRD